MCMCLPVCLCCWLLNECLKSWLTEVRHKEKQNSVVDRNHSHDGGLYSMSCTDTYFGNICKQEKIVKPLYSTATQKNEIIIIIKRKTSALTRRHSRG